MLLEKHISMLQTTVDKNSPRQYGTTVCFSEGFLFSTNGFYLTYTTIGTQIEGRGTITSSGPQQNAIPPMVSSVIMAAIQAPQIIKLEVIDIADILMLAKSVKTNKKLALGISSEKHFILVPIDTIKRFPVYRFINPDLILRATCFSANAGRISEDSLILADDSMKAIIVGIKS